jgi:hypothetical protein
MGMLYHHNQRLRSVSLTPEIRKATIITGIRTKSGYVSEFVRRFRV